MAKAALTLAFTPLHRVEVHEASRNAKANGEVTAADCRLAFRQIEDDLRDGSPLLPGAFVLAAAQKFVHHPVNEQASKTPREADERHPG